jgi:hypothetical protein
MPAALLISTADAAIYNERTAIILGFLTLTSVLAVFLTCRTCQILLSRLGLRKLVSSRAYQWFYTYHAYYWWVFLALLLAHFMMGFLHTGFPKAGDPDAAIHWYILGAGFAAALLALSLLASCRIAPRLLTIVTGRKPTGNADYLKFFRLHNYLWWPVLAFVAAHFAVAFSHAGIWPR